MKLVMMLKQWKQLVLLVYAVFYQTFLCVFQADAQVEMEKRGFYQASMKYVLKLQEVQEKKKFEFVEIVSNCW